MELRWQEIATFCQYAFSGCIGHLPVREKRGKRRKKNAPGQRNNDSKGLAVCFLKKEQQVKVKPRKEPTVSRKYSRRWISCASR